MANGAGIEAETSLLRNAKKKGLMFEAFCSMKRKDKKQKKSSIFATLELKVIGAEDSDEEEKKE